MISCGTLGVVTGHVLTGVRRFDFESFKPMGVEGWNLGAVSC